MLLSPTSTRPRGYQGLSIEKHFSSASVTPLPLELWVCLPAPAPCVCEGKSRAGAKTRIYGCMPQLSLSPPDPVAHGKHFC